ncbi:hypothetical protein C1645_742199 [Glomus cerebriforme]|uniref:Uncharacterized protein n=1 Tax=Glomus cerebriforme TaxID=658196 RepID=A0A397SIB0_9GLOM|nr:hypothetical protein C1645_742199 [Glomus cerebriforme]
MDLDDIINTLKSTLTLSHNDDNDITKIINNTIESPNSTTPLLENTNQSFHNPNNTPSAPSTLSKGKNKEIHASIPNQGIIAPVKIAHTFNEISQTPKITNNKDTASNSDLDEIDIADIQLSCNANQYIAFTPLHILPNKPLWKSNNLSKPVFVQHTKKPSKAY